MADEGLAISHLPFLPPYFLLIVNFGGEENQASQMPREMVPLSVSVRPYLDVLAPRAALR